MGLSLALISGEASAEVVAYQISGRLQKGSISDPLFGAATEPVGFEIRFEADTSLAAPVPALSPTNLPNAPKIAFAEDAFFLTSSALKSLHFRLTRGDARFSIVDLIADPSTPGVIFVTGTFGRPSAVHLLLANSKRLLPIDFPNALDIRSRACGAAQAGPFGTIEALDTGLCNMFPPVT